MQSNKPLLSVIMPAFNTGKYIHRAITSILDQTCHDFELMVIDDGSTDNTVEVIRQFNDPRLKFFSFGENKGKVAACNTMLQECRGKYITIHDSDDYSLPERFQKQLDFLENNKSFAMCGTQFFEIDERGKVINKMILQTDPAIIKELAKVDSQFHGPTMIFRKEILDDIGGLYRNFRNKEDVDLAMRIAEKYDVTNLDEYLYYYRLIPQGLSKANFDFLRFEGLKVLQALARQREESGKDCLMRGDQSEFNAILLSIKKPYIDDPSLLYRKAISLSVYFKFWRNAYRYSVRAIRANPVKLINYRELLYVIKVSLLNIIFKKNG